jgi:hypothetical protein
MNEIINTEKISKELDLIKNIFDRKINGSLFCNYDIYSNTALFDTSLIQSLITKGFEATIYNSLFWEQIKELSAKVESVLCYLEKNLITPDNINLLSKNIIEREKNGNKELSKIEIDKAISRATKISKKEFKQAIHLPPFALDSIYFNHLKVELFKPHKDSCKDDAVIMVHNYSIKKIYSGTNSLFIDNELLNKWDTSYSYTMQSNMSFLEYLKELIDFFNLVLSVKAFKNLLKKHTTNYSYTLNELLKFLTMLLSNEISTNDLRTLDQPIIEIDKNHKSKKNKKLKPTQFKLVRIKVEKLCETLANRQYIDNSDKDILIKWFKGNPPDEPINIEKPANHFATIIAELKENNYIKNTKEFCIDYIYKTLLFKRNQIESNYIRGIISRNQNRITSQDSKNHINIDAFRIANSTQ